MTNGERRASNVYRGLPLAPKSFFPALPTPLTTQSVCLGFCVLSWISGPDSAAINHGSLGLYAVCQHQNCQYLESCSGEGNGNPLQYSCLENPMGRGAWQAAAHGVVKSRTRLSDFTFTHWRRKWQPTPVFSPGESQGRGSLVGCRLWVTQSQTRLKQLSSSSSSSRILQTTSAVVFSFGF